AYAAADIERSDIGRLPVSRENRIELDRLAHSAPGLENDRMLALMRSTASLDDRRLIQDIRRAGTEIGRSDNQGTPDIRSHIEVLENRTRLSQRPADASGDAAAGATEPSARAPAGRQPDQATA